MPEPHAQIHFPELIEFTCDTCGKPATWMHPGAHHTCDEHKERT